MSFEMAIIAEDQTSVKSSFNLLCKGVETETSYGRLVDLIRSSNRSTIIARDDLPLSKTTAIPRSLFKFTLHLQNGKGVDEGVIETYYSKEYDIQFKDQNKYSRPSVSELNPLMQTVGFISDMLPYVHKNEAELVVKVVSELDVVEGIEVNLITPGKSTNSTLETPGSTLLNSGYIINKQRRNCNCPRRGGTCTVKHPSNPNDDAQRNRTPAQSGIFSLTVFAATSALGEERCCNLARETKLSDPNNRNANTYKSSRVVRKVRGILATAFFKPSNPRCQDNSSIAKCRPEVNIRLSSLNRLKEIVPKRVEYLQQSTELYRAGLSLRKQE